jgi:hypothetical protein
VTGLAVLAFLMSGFAVCSAVALGHMCHVERRKRRFLDRVALSMNAPFDIETGDICRPLLFTVDNVRVGALLRGDVEVWQLERYDRRLQHTSLALVDCDWHADAEVRAMPTVASLTPRLCVRAVDERSACSLVWRMRAELASVLGRHTRQCVVGDGRAFLEVSRTGLSVDELGDAMMRLHGIICVLTGCRVLVPMASSQQAIAGPMGVPIPGVALA